MTKPKPKIKSLKYALRLLREEYKSNAGLRWELDRHNEMFARGIAERKMLARLAAKTPQFFNPIEGWAAEKLRDDILAGRRI